MIRIALPLLGALMIGLVAPACSSSRPLSRSTGQTGFTDGALNSEPLAARLDRGDWMVNTKSKIWKVYESQRSGPERHVGYLVGSKYRQMRGGPEFRMFKVTTLDRDDQIGHIDQMGRAVRYEPRRDGEFIEIPVGTSSRDENVASIFDTQRPIRLQETSNRELAFEALDLDGNSKLDKEEIAPWSGRLAQADVNRDGFVDYGEFKDVDEL